MSAIFIYRNCFTGDVSGGDMHTGGVAEWIHDQQPQHKTYLVHAANDGQAAAYRETAKLREVTYPGTPIKTPALMFLLRARKAANLKLPLHPASNIFIAGSHFLPDVWPAVVAGKRAPGAHRVAYIHHIVQDMPRPASLNTQLANAQERMCFYLIKKHFDKIITVNEDVVEGLRKRGFTQPILCSSNFVSAHATQPTSYAEKDITLAFCGRLVTQKGVDDFVELCEKLAPQVPDFKAVMIGAGPEQERLQQHIKNKELPIEVTGFVPDRQKFALLGRSKLFAFPSIEEGWGIAIAEALSVGTPVLAYDLPVYRQPFGGYIQVVPLGKPQALVHTVRQQLAQWDKTPAAYTTLQKRLTKRAASFSRERVAGTEFTFLMEDHHADSQQP